MIDQATETTAAKPRRPRAPRSTRPPVERSVKIGVYISPASARRLGATALMEGKDKSALVDELISLHLNRYVISDRARPANAALTVTEDRHESSAG